MDSQAKKFTHKIQEIVFGMGPTQVLFFARNMAKELFEIDPEKFEYVETDDADFGVKSPMDNAQWTAVLNKLENKMYSTELVGDVMKFRYGIRSN